MPVNVDVLYPGSVHCMLEALRTFHFTAQCDWSETDIQERKTTEISHLFSDCSGGTSDISNVYVCEAEERKWFRPITAVCSHWKRTKRGGAGHRRMS